MANYNLTGQKIKDTYEQLAQVSASLLVDGTGSLTPILTSSIVSFPTEVSRSAAAAGFGSGGGGVSEATFTTYTSSNDSKVNSLTSATSSYAIKTQISGAFTSTSASLAANIATNTTNITTNTTNIGINTSNISTLTGQTSSYALKTAISGAFNTGSLLLTASFSNPNLTFTKGDGTTFQQSLVSLVPTSASHAVNSNIAISASFATTASFAINVIPPNTGSLLVTASISNATTTFTKGDGTTFNLTTNNVQNASTASIAITASHALNVGLVTGGGVNSIKSADFLTATASDASGLDSIAIGNNARAVAVDAMAFGKNSNATVLNSTAIGVGATVNGVNGVAIGRATVNGVNGYALGDGSTANGTNTVAMGIAASAGGDESISIGTSHPSSGNNSVAIGRRGACSGDGAISIGSFTSVNGNNAIALGANVTITGNNSISIGDRFKFDGVSSIFLSGSVTGSGGFKGNLDGNATTATTATSASFASTASIATFAITATSASFATTSSFSAGNFEVSGQIFSPVFSGSIASSTASFDFDNGNFAVITLTTPTHIDNPSNTKSGTTYTLIINSGSLVTTYGTSFKFVGSNLPTLSNGVDILTMVSDGSRLFATGLANFL